MKFTEDLKGQPTRSSNVANQVHNFVSFSDQAVFDRYTLYFSDECLMAPNALFYPDLFELTSSTTKKRIRWDQGHTLSLVNKTTRILWRNPQSYMHWGSEYQTCLVFKWSKPVRLRNGGSEFECHQTGIRCRAATYAGSTPFKNSLKSSVWIIQ